MHVSVIFISLSLACFVAPSGALMLRPLDAGLLFDGVRPAELETLCHETGLVRACDALNNAVQREEVVSLTAVRQAEKCLPSGSVVFDHVMKSGGLSVDDFFKCACDDGAGIECAIQRSDGSSRLIQPSHSVCEPSICTAHGAVTQVSQRCGDNFRHASHFTVLRDPVDRVWSLYNYLSRWYVPYQTNSLESILTNFTDDLNEGLPRVDQCGLCHKQLSNAMVHKFDETGSLSRAKHVLAGYTAVLDVHSLGNLPAILKSMGLFPDIAHSTGAKACNVPQHNPSTYRYGKHPDERTMALINEHNKADVALYNYAKTLPNFVDAH